MPETTIFYAWQSDRDPKTNRFFIREAIDEAIQALNVDASVEDAVRLDHDTKGVTGIPDIARTIFQKINQCGLFIADVTFIGDAGGTESGAPSKLLPNPNVMIELGYALKSIGPERIIYIMNTAHGGPDHLPFDLRTRRHPLQYNLVSATGRKAARSTLADQLKLAIKAILNASTVTNQADEQARRSAAQKRINEERNEFEMAVLQHQFQRVEPENGVITIALLPEEPIQPPISFSSRAARQITLRLIHQDHDDRPDFHARSANVIDRYTKDDKPFAGVELDSNGAVKIADGYLLSGGEGPAHLQKDYGDQIRGMIPTPWMENKIFHAVTANLKTMRSLGVRGTIYSAISLHRILGYVIDANTFGMLHGHGFRIFERNDIKPDAVMMPESLDHNNPVEVAKALKPIFDHIWVDMGYEGSRNFDEAGNWIAGL